MSNGAIINSNIDTPTQASSAAIGEAAKGLETIWPPPEEQRTTQNGEPMTSTLGDNHVTPADVNPPTVNDRNKAMTSRYDATKVANNKIGSTYANTGLRRPAVRYSNATNVSTAGTAAPATSSVRRSSSEMSHWRNRLNMKPSSSSSRPGSDMDVTRSLNDDVTPHSTTSGNGITSLSSDFKSSKGTRLSASNEVFLLEIRNIAKRRQQDSSPVAAMSSNHIQQQSSVDDAADAVVAAASVGTVQSDTAAAAAAAIDDPLHLQQQQQQQQEATKRVQLQTSVVSEYSPNSNRDTGMVQFKPADRKLTHAVSRSPEAPSTSAAKSIRAPKKRWTTSSTEEVTPRQQQQPQQQQQHGAGPASGLHTDSSISRIPQKTTSLRYDWEQKEQPQLRVETGTATQTNDLLRHPTHVTHSLAAARTNEIGGKPKSRTTSPESHIVFRRPIATRPSLISLTALGDDLSVRPTALRTGPTPDVISGVRRRRHVPTPSKIPTLKDSIGKYQSRVGSESDDVIYTWQTAEVPGEASRLRYRNTLNSTSLASTSVNGVLPAVTGHQLYHIHDSSTSAAAENWRTPSRRSRLPVLVKASHIRKGELIGYVREEPTGHNGVLKNTEYRIQSLPTTTVTSSGGDMHSYGFVHRPLDGGHAYTSTDHTTAVLSDVELLDNFDQLSTSYQPLAVIPPITVSSKSPRSPRLGSAASSHHSGRLSAGSRPATAAFKSALRKSSARSSANRKRKRVHFEPTLEMVRLITKIDYPWNVPQDNGRLPATNWSYHYNYHSSQY